MHYCWHPNIRSKKAPMTSIQRAPTLYYYKYLGLLKGFMKRRSREGLSQAEVEDRVMELARAGDYVWATISGKTPPEACLTILYGQLIPSSQPN